MQKCRVCGTDIPPGATFCPSCGTTTYNTSTPQSGPYNPVSGSPARPYPPVNPTGPDPYNPSVTPNSNPYNPASVAGSNPYNPISAPGSNPYNNPAKPATTYGSTPYNTGSPNPYDVPNPYAGNAPPPPPTNPVFNPPPGQQGSAPRKSSKVRTFLLVGLALLIVLAASGIFFVINKNQTDTANAHATATAQSIVTATSQAQASATHVAATATAVTSTYPFSNNVALDDPLSGNNKGVNWDEVTLDTGSFCKFTNSSYHVREAKAGFFTPCAATSSNFSNFTYQVNMTLIEGDGGGGLIFRADENNNKFYKLTFYVDKSYAISVFSDADGKNTRVLTNGTAGSFNPAYNQNNVIGVTARGSSIDIYVNNQHLTTVTDTTYTHGQIGVFAVSDTKATEVAFSNVKVWKLA